MCHNMCGRGANEGSLNGTIEEMVCGCKVGTWVVYTCTALHAGEKNGTESTFFFGSDLSEIERASVGHRTRSRGTYLYHDVGLAQF